MTGGPSRNYFNCEHFLTLLVPAKVSNFLEKIYYGLCFSVILDMNCDSAINLPNCCTSFTFFGLYMSIMA